MPIPATWNANLHPEMDDQEFATTALKVYWGWDDTQVAQWDANTAGLATTLTQIQQNGRYSWLQGLFGQKGNSTDGWFYNLPPYTWLIVLPVVAITAGILLWRAWGKDLYSKSFGSNGSSGRL